MLEILRCPGCSAPVALADAESVRCAHCGATCPLPARYRELHRQAESSRAARRRAEELWRQFPEPLSLRFHRLATGAVIAVAVAAPAAMAALALSGAHFSVRAWIVLGGLVPSAVALYPVLEALAHQAPFARLLARLCARDGERGQASCRGCGAPLALEPDALAATCDYCGCDSLVARPAAAASRKLSEQHREAIRSLEQAVLNVRMRKVQLLVLRILWPSLWAACLLALWLALPS